MSDPEENEREGRGVLDVLRHVVDTLVEMERAGETRGSGHGTTSRGVRTDYGFDAKIGARPDPDSLWDRLGVEGSEERDATREPGLGDETREEYLVDVRSDDDGFVVLADLPRATAESVTAGVDSRNRLVIGIDDEVVERIPIGDAEIIAADTTFRNGVLEVRLRTEVGER
ncbi:gas vesicle protein GvpH [Natronorarus salvus]|uniref:gas vesicle protein GvpH n=1 Tax=Natronorarus salvus TaxID=3117733 RepID=UPI002F268ABA